MDSEKIYKDNTKTGGASSDAAVENKYAQKVATRVLPMQIDELGRPFWESYLTPESYQTRSEARIQPHLPGIVIFVHGVNSEGEWYENAENAICEGLNKRLGRGDLQANLYVAADADGNPAARSLSKRGRSPVIRFFWGYRPKDGKERDWRVPLRNIEGEDGWDTKHLQELGPWYWGGGPFQNGTNNLQQMWSEDGFKRALLKVINLQWFNTEWDRELHDSPGRQYYAHAAQRLANLIDKIRTRCPHDTITVMSHSQGTMVSMAATLMCKTRAPDTLFVMNSPFAFDDKSTDFITTWHDRPTEQARLNTFRNVAARIKKDKRVPFAGEAELLHVGATRDKQLWSLDAITNGIKERDNHGRLYVYFNPHDRVMGAKPLGSIGWQGIPTPLIDELDEVVKQRMLARGTPCGDAPGMTNFGSLPPIPNPEPEVKSTDFWNGMRSPLGMDLWIIPDKNQQVKINAEKVPHPLSAAEMSKKSERRVTLIKDGEIVEQFVDRYFDEARSDQDGLGARDREGNLLEPTVKNFESIHQLEKQVEKDPYSTGPIMRTENRAEMIKRFEEYQPMPTNHSTLPQHHEFMSRVAAWDLPIGFCEAYDEPGDFWLQLVSDADWTLLRDEYFKDGTLNVPPVPAGIDQEKVIDQIVATRDQQKKLEGIYR